MFELVETVRKTAVLKHPTLPCLGKHYTINLLSGCPYECRYCYTQSYTSHPGWGKVMFYANTLESLKRELGRMRRRPEMVYFSTACEPFTAHPKVLGMLFEVMRVLLERGISILISTKSRIPEEFLPLLAEHRERVVVQAGLTTAEDRVRQVIEPAAPAVAERLANILHLYENKIPFEVRADPIIPELTDTRDNIQNLFEAISQRGARRVVVSYVFLRSANVGPLSQIRHEGFSFAETAGRRFTQTIDHYCGHNTIRVVDAAYRGEKYREIEAIGKNFGLAVGFCRCKNTDMTGQCCHPAEELAGRGRVSGEQMVFPY